MNQNNLFKLFTETMLGVMFIFMLQSCDKQTDTNSGNKNAVSNSEEEVRTAIKSAYKYYSKSDLRWVDFYNDTYTEISENGSVQTHYADSLRNQWVKIYKKYDVTLTSLGKPTIIASKNQALHFNTVSEIFVNKENQDTIGNAGKGIWIAVWEKQKDGSWKIVFDTYQKSKKD